MFSVPASVSTASAIRALSGSLLALSTIAVIGRFWARVLQKTHYQADDWLMIPAWLTFVGLCACMLESTYIHTLGYTPAEAAPFHPSPVDSAKVQLTIDIFLAVCLGTTKASALFFYKRVLCPPHDRSVFRTILNISIAAVACWTVAYIIFPLSLCGDHLDGYWNRPVFNKYCPTAHPYLISGSATDVFFELLVIFIPIPKVLQLQTTTRRKMAIILIFLTAFLSLGASLARLVIVVHLATQTITDAAVAALGNSAIFSMWTLEAGASIIAINMPSLWYFRTRKAPEKILGSLRSVLSLNSLKSRSSGGSRRGKLANGVENTHSNTEGTTRTSASTKGSTTRVHVGAEMTSGSDDIPRVPSGRDIKVTNSVTQSIENV